MYDGCCFVGWEFCVYPQIRSCFISSLLIFCWPWKGLNVIWVCHLVASVSTTNGWPGSCLQRGVIPIHFVEIRYNLMKHDTANYYYSQLLLYTCLILFGQIFKLFLFFIEGVRDRQTTGLVSFVWCVNQFNPINKHIHCSIIYCMCVIIYYLDGWNQLLIRVFHFSSCLRNLHVKQPEAGRPPVWEVLSLSNKWNLKCHSWFIFQNLKNLTWKIINV